MFFLPSDLGTGALIAIALLAVVVISYASNQAVSHARQLAGIFGVSPVIIGLTIVSIGTSLPEIFVNLTSGQAGAFAIGGGNIVGSCLSQITLILGITILVAGTATVAKSTLHRDGGLLLFSIVAVAALGHDGRLSRLDGALLVLVYLAYLGFLIRVHRNDEQPRDPARSDRSAPVAMLLLLFWLAVVYVSAQVITDNGILLGRRFGIDESIIGIISGVGTSLPELAVSLTALVRRASGISIGNLIGSNITDPFFSLGISAVAFDYRFATEQFLLPVAFWGGGTLLALFFMRTGLRLGRWEGVALMAVFGVYVWIGSGAF